jgi:hypothetical protein
MPRVVFPNQVWRDQYIPMPETVGQCSTPFAQARFTCVDFLTTTH